MRSPAGAASAVAVALSHPWQGHGSGPVQCPYFHLGGCVGCLGVFFSKGRSVGPGFCCSGLGSCDFLLSAGRLQAVAAFSAKPCHAPVVLSAAGGQLGVAWLCLVSAP